MTDRTEKRVFMIKNFVATVFAQCREIYDCMEVLLDCEYKLWGQLHDGAYIFELQKKDDDGCFGDIVDTYSVDIDDAEARIDEISNVLDDLYVIEVGIEHLLLQGLDYSGFMKYLEVADIYGEGVKYVLSYDDWAVVDIDGRCFFYTFPTEDSSDTFYEVKLVAKMEYSVENDIKLEEGETLEELFDCSVCGEEVYDDRIVYYWFR